MTTRTTSSRRPTLTGGQVIALGKRIAGVMGDADAVRAGRAWPATGSVSLPGRCRSRTRSASGMDSDVADISQTNASMDRAGHMLQGGAFLRGS